MAIKSFKALKAHWDAKLKKDGFVDIEDAHGRLKQHNTRTIAFDFRDDIRDYFIALDHYITAHESTIPALELRILRLHSAGVHRIQIQKAVGIGETKVKKILRHYREIVLGIKPGLQSKTDDDNDPQNTFP